MSGSNRQDAGITLTLPGGVSCFRGSSGRCAHCSRAERRQQRVGQHAPRHQTALRIASDLLGVLPAEYIEPLDGDWMSALSEACRLIDDALYTSARTRGARSTPLAADVMRDCIAHVNRAMQHVTATVAARASADDACVETLPDSAGFIVRCGTRSDLTVRFGRIEDCTCDEPGTVIALPANEFFDDACVSDVRSALGSFVHHHFADKLEAFKRLVATERQQFSPTLVEREAHLIVYRQAPDAAPAIEPDVARRILTSIVPGVRT